MTGPAGDTAPATRTPHVVRSRADLARAVNERAEVGDVHLVPTMGALHEGHAALIRTARAEARADDVVVVSIFVNPLQFGPGEDLHRYPRTFDADLEVCGREGVDVVFAPEVDQVYPSGEPQVTVHPGPLGELLEGASRPTHFRGVLTVVAKLLGLVRPDRLYLGEKDYQQLVLVRRMVEDLCLGVDVVGVPTVRETDGLALSSRNRYLEPAQRRSALALSGALHAGAAAGAEGAETATSRARAVLAAADLDLDYLALTAPDLGPAPDAGEARLLVAARLGTTRLIDNTALTLGAGAARPSRATADPRSS